MQRQLHTLRYKIFISILHHYLHESWPEAAFLQALYDPVLVLGAEGFYGDAQLHALLAVRADELVVVQLDDVALLLGDELSHLYQLAGLVRKDGGDCEDPVSLDQTELYHGGHGDDIHIAAAQDGNDFFALYVHVA